MAVKLRPILTTLSEKELETYTRWWGLTKQQRGNEWQAQLSDLMHALQDDVAARFAWEHLSVNERKVLYNALTFSASADGVMYEVLLKICRIPETDFDIALATLKKYYLILENRGTLKAKPGAKKTAGSTAKTATAVNVNWLIVPEELRTVLSDVGHEIFSQATNPTSLTLEKVLFGLPPQQLIEINNRYGYTSDNGYYGFNYPAKTLAGRLVQPDALYTAWEKFDKETRAVCKLLGEAKDSKILLQEIRSVLKYDDAQLARIIHALESFAVAFDTFIEQERVLFVPKGLAKSLKRVLEEPEAEAPPSTELRILESPPSSISNADTVLLYDLAIIIGAIYQQPIEPTQAGRIPKRIASKIRPLLHGFSRMQYGGEDDYLDMLFYVAQQLGLVQTSVPMGTEVKPRYQPARGLEKWAEKDAVEQTEEILQFWQKGQYWQDIAGIHYTYSNEYYFIDMKTVRGLILKELAQCTPGRWYALESFLNKIKYENPLALRPRQPRSTITSPQARRKLLADWDKLDGQILTGILSSSLHEFGLVSLGYRQALPPTPEHPVNPDFFQLTELASAVLPTEGGSKSASKQDASGRVLIVQPNFELLLLQPDFTTLYQLLPFAQANQIELVSRLTITKNSVLHGIEAGWSIERILQTLESHSQKELPQNVVYTLRDWGKLYKDAAVSQVYLLEVTSEAVADELCSSPKFKTLNLRRLGPLAMVVGEGVSIQVLRTTLDKEGVILRINGEIVSTNKRASSGFSYGRL